MDHYRRAYEVEVKTARMAGAMMEIYSGENTRLRSELSAKS